MKNAIIAAIESANTRATPLGDFNVGDTVNVHTLIKEGDKERVQIFTGTVIRRSRGHGTVNSTFTVRRVTEGHGIERVFPDQSPKIVKVDVSRRGRVRRSRLYYLRDRVGKSTKVKELIAKR